MLTSRPACNAPLHKYRAISVTSGWICTRRPSGTLRWRATWLTSCTMRRTLWPTCTGASYAAHGASIAVCSLAGEARCTCWWVTVIAQRLLISGRGLQLSVSSPASNSRHTSLLPPMLCCRQLAKGGYRGEPIRELYCDEVRVSTGGLGNRGLTVMGWRFWWDHHSLAPMHPPPCCSRPNSHAAAAVICWHLHILDCSHPVALHRTSHKQSCCWACAWCPALTDSFCAETPARPSPVASASGGGTTLLWDGLRHD